MLQGFELQIQNPFFLAQLKMIVGFIQKTQKTLHEKTHPCHPCFEPGVLEKNTGRKKTGGFTGIDIPVKVAPRAVGVLSQLDERLVT
jgi:hypothetical protein